MKHGPFRIQWRILPQVIKTSTLKWTIMSFRGDSERQTLLRDQSIKKSKKRRDEYISEILSVLKPQMKLLDIGCGTAHIIQELAKAQRDSIFVGLDVSSHMLKTANENTGGFKNVILVHGDGFGLPFPNNVFDVVITRLAIDSPKEAYRVLRKGGCFFEYSLGPEADREIKEFFPERIEEQSFFFPRSIKEWKQEVCEDILRAGFIVCKIEDYKEEDHYGNEQELMDLIEMVPLVRDFDRKRDEKTIKKLAKKYRNEKGVKITWHYYIMIARKP
jgi:ubiquinone/menaquinone biosynthesis C-methylase UbiE